MRRWLWLPLALLALLPLVAGLAPPAEANSELHLGARLFYPLWDVSTPNRLTFIIVTREARREDSSISQVPTGTLIGGVPTIINRFRVTGTPGNCIPRGAAGSSSNINRTDLGGTSTNPVFVDDLHFEYYGKTCQSANETIHMSCADIDLFLLASNDNAVGNQPRLAFDSVAGQGRGALDVHLVRNGTQDPRFRKDAVIGESVFNGTFSWQYGDESLMGHAIISDVAEGWAATYPAASARATSCGVCAFIDGGTPVGYEPFPIEVMLPFALAEPFPTQGGNLRNVLSLWGPSVLPGNNLSDTTISVDIRWWDGRERNFSRSEIAHSLIRPLGGPAIAGLDSPIDSTRFNIANFVCGHAASTGQAENDGFPRTAGTGATACGVQDVPDIAHPSDNFESTPDVDQPGHTIQSSTPIGWWRFLLRRDGQQPLALATSDLSTPEGSAFDHSGRGLVGVVLSSTQGSNLTEGNRIGVGDATRLWHKAPCEIASSGISYGPPHLGMLERHGWGSTQPVVWFNSMRFDFQRAEICDIIE